MSDNKKLTPQDITDILEENDVMLLGNKVAVMLYEPDNMLSEHIVAAETHAVNPHQGRVVW